MHILRTGWDPARCSPRGFTLVELLVVIAIIVAIVAILLPTFASIRRSSRVAADLANLRLLQAAQLSYASDSDGYLADARLPHGGVNQEIEESFVTTLRPYYDSSFALRHVKLRNAAGDLRCDNVQIAPGHFREQVEAFGRASVPKGIQLAACQRLARFTFTATLEH